MNLASPQTLFSAARNVQVRPQGRADYLSTWQAMQDFTRQRGAETVDEIWQVEHSPVFTLGQAGKREHLLRDIDIPIVHVDRGGQVTYHGPGQAVIYLLLDLARLRLKVRDLVHSMEQAVIDLLNDYNIEARRQNGAPGVYVGDAKIAALGLRVRHGCCYHGLAVNVDMDLAPFSAINPCGYEGLAVTQLSDLGLELSLDQVFFRLTRHLLQQLEMKQSP